MGLILKLLGGSAGPWILIGLAISATAGAGYCYVAGKTAQRHTDELAQAKAIEKAVGLRDARLNADLQTRQAADHEAAVSLSARNADLAAQLAALAALPAKVLIKTKVVDNGCPVVSLSDDFWSRYRAAGLPLGARGDPHRTQDPATP